MGNYVAKLITDPDIIVGLWEDIKKVPLFNYTYDQVLINCLTHTYHVVGGYENDELKSFAIIQVLQKNEILVVAVYAPNNVRQSLRGFLIWCKENNVTKFSSISNADQEAYTRLMGMKYEYSVYSRELN